MVVLTCKHPEMIKPLLAHQTMIVREARRCGGNGWLAYDTYFQQQVAGGPKADWSCLNTSLYAVTFLAQGGKGGQSCTTCMETDHTQYDCAVSRHRSQLPTLAKCAYLSSSREPITADRGRRRSTGTSRFVWRVPVPTVRVPPHMSALFGGPPNDKMPDFTPGARKKVRS